MSLFSLAVINIRKIAFHAIFTISAFLVISILHYFLTRTRISKHPSPNMISSSLRFLIYLPAFRIVVILPLACYLQSRHHSLITDQGTISRLLL
jgi:hypothetical protein